MDGFYSVSKGYSALQTPHCSVYPLAIWKSVWYSHCLPKVNFFAWLVLNNKILTGESLMKRGFKGPSCCCLCKFALETADHLLVDCAFSRSVLEIILRDVLSSFSIQNSEIEFYIAWHENRPVKSHSEILHNNWHSILKFTWWAIWIARNCCIFKD